jgi:glutaredoxin 3
MAKAYLSDKKIAYTEKDVQFDIAAREEMVQKSGQLGVPVIDIDGTIIVGFDKPRVDELLDLA